MTSKIWGAMMKAASVRTWALIGAMVALSSFSSWLVWLVYKGPWLQDRQPQQLDILGWALWASLLIISLGFIALTGLGVAASVGRGGVSLNVGDDDHEAVTVTTETTVAKEPKA